MYIDISLDIYKIFCTVVKAGNMSLAAKELYISQPAVSMAIKQMESKFGRTLLHRTSKGITPTTEGHVLFEHLNRALSLVDVAERKYMEILNLESGEIRLGGGDTIIGRFLLPHIEQFVSVYPDINIKVTNRTSMGTLELLKNGQIDIGFINFPIENEDGLETYKCRTVQDCLIGGAKYKFLSESGIELQELKKYPILALEPGSNSRRNLDCYIRKNGIMLAPNIELGSMDLLTEFVRINLGIGFVIKEFVQKELEMGQVFEIPLNPPIPERHIGFVKLKDATLSNAAHKFLEAICDMRKNF